MPVRGRDKVDEESRQSWFSHQSEEARPYYYSVYLADHDIKAEIAPTERAAIMRFTFPESDESGVVIDAFDRGSYIRVMHDKRTVAGYTTRNSGGVPDNFKNWFIVRFDRKIRDFQIYDGTKPVEGEQLVGEHALVRVGFETRRGEQVTVRAASSFISQMQAVQNLEELGKDDFETVKAKAQARWDEVLGRIEVEGGTTDQYRTFYSCLYRSTLFPRKFYEIDKNGNILHYSPYNGEVLPGYMYTDTGFWDTFRSLFPLLNLVYPSVNAEIQALVDKFNFNLNITDKVSDISVGAKQRVEILKMLYRDVDLLILDEPTAVLIPQEVDDLIRRLIDLKKAGKTIIIITHKLNEVKMCADNITVIRAGHVIGTVPNDENTTDEDLAEMMVGRAVLLRVKKSGKPVGGKVAYQVNHLSAVNSEGKKILNDISFRIHENEVVGIAGVEGNGQTELMLALTGLLDVCHGSTVELGGVNITGLWPDELRKHDIGVVPEDRYKQGLCLDVPVSANLIAGYHGLKPYCNKGVMNRRAITENRDRLVEEYDVRLSTKDPAVGSLSGGNAQKVIIAREFSRRPKVLLVSQPTRGVDIGAIEFIHNQILKMRDASTAVLIISSELSEVTGLSDRVLVMYHGEIVGSFRSDDVSFNELGLYMSGVKRMSSEELSEE